MFVIDDQYFWSYATFDKILLHHETDLKHAVTMPTI